MRCLKARIRDLQNNSLLLGWFVWLFIASLGFAADPAVDYVTQVKPLLRARC
jgi:hypothetical protein